MFDLTDGESVVSEHDCLDCWTAWHEQDDDGSLFEDVGWSPEDVGSACDGSLLEDVGWSPGDVGCACDGSVDKAISVAESPLSVVEDDIVGGCANRTDLVLLNPITTSCQNTRFSLVVGDLMSVVASQSCHGTTQASSSHEHMSAASAIDSCAPDQWLLDSGASAHLVSEEPLQRVRVLSESPQVDGDCVTATGAMVGVRRKVVILVDFELFRGKPVTVQLEALVALVRFNLLSVGLLVRKGWIITFRPAKESAFSVSWASNCAWLKSKPLRFNASTVQAAASNHGSTCRWDVLQQQFGGEGQAGVLGDPCERGSGSLPDALPGPRGGADDIEIGRPAPSTRRDSVCGDAAGGCSSDPAAKACSEGGGQSKAKGLDCHQSAAGAGEEEAETATTNSGRAADEGAAKGAYSPDGRTWRNAHRKEAEEAKIKVTADLNRDRIITFLGRQFQRSSPEESLSFGMDASYYQEVYDEFGLSKTVKPSVIPPNVRDLYDREDPALDKPLSVEACQRYRSTLGKLSWLAMTRVDLAYYVSMLARGQANPCKKHERALRAVLRWLKHIEGYRQVVSSVEEKDLILRCYVDASWGSEKSVDRKSISGGCVFLGPFCLKAWTRLQQAVALSSAESELYALVEGAKEAPGVRCAISHAFGWVELQQPWIYCDSEAACAISKADGLRKVRHIDLRACFIQDQIRQRNIHVFSVRGTENPADLFTKSLDVATALKRMAALGLDVVERCGSWWSLAVSC